MSKASLAVQRRLLVMLSDGEFRSGQLLADDVGLSRTAVANHIAQLQQLGLDIYKVKGRGYCLAKAIDLLDAAKIAKLQPAGAAPVLVQNITDSTNSQLLQRLTDNLSTEPGFTLVAEAQTAGRGRRGRNWFSPLAASLYFSLYWRLEQGIQSAMGLSLVVGLALVRLLKQQYQVEAKVKWPNDVYVDNRKLAGVLVELAGQAHAACDVVIGIGLNIQLPEGAGKTIDQQYSDLAEVTASHIDRNALIVSLQTILVQMLENFSTNGFAAYVDEFNQCNQFQQQAVRLIGNREIQGVCMGVDAQGGLLLNTGSKTEAFYGGELSLRAGA